MVESTSNNATDDGSGSNSALRAKISEQARLLTFFASSHALFENGTWRVGGILAMSLAFGNRQLKRFVVADPEIQLGIWVLLACIMVGAHAFYLWAADEYGSQSGGESGSEGSSDTRDNVTEGQSSLAAAGHITFIIHQNRNRRRVV